MPPSAELHTDAGSESESEEFEDDGVETDDDEGAGPESSEDGVETGGDEGFGSGSEDGVGTEDDGAGEGHDGRAGARVPDAAAGCDGGVEAGTPAACCVCMEPWTCSGAHRICCIPCGHVYGRSCLERWLRRCGSRSAKCPQCGERFELRHITNLYVPENLWDDCCRVEIHKLMEKGKAAFNELIHKHIPELRSELQKVYQKQLDHDVGAMVETFVSTKEQMKKMAEQNATPMDLIEFMEQSCSQLPIPSRYSPPEDRASE
ncbi:E3 ubiquitin-protein ligase RFWD3-like isoform X1 [Panicum virgatum]|uniref:RING-type domain-containing protein n=1 Tax=Panicum virgatum TaxID=38727 RepID=A0A8T0NPK9_PANVG|nr:E3 ubiquitin-protein ligase RFWD3-like isoform X1 [Panicum virgatum]KAG2549126.1 hypothetical protein PVAP13_9KG171300 [Panicum virgatum]